MSAPIGLLSAGSSDARRLILIHGTPGSAGAWSSFMQSAPPDLHVIAIDRPGFGRSSPEHAETRLAEQARALETVLPGAGEPGAILLGHSLGAAVAAEAAARYPERIDAIILAGGSLDPDLERVFWIQRLFDLRAISWLVPRTLRHSNRELIAFESELRLLQPRLRQVACPVIAVHGTRDRLVPYANVSYMEQAFVNALHFEVVRLDGAGHLLHWNEHAALWDAVDRADRASRSSLYAHRR